MKKLGLCLLMMTPVVGAANIDTSYFADTDESHWVFSGDNTHCTIRHPLPRYGEAQIENKNGRQPRLIIQTKHGPAKKGKAKLLVVPQNWDHKTQARVLGDIDVEPGYTPFKVNSVLTRQVLDALDAGLAPILVYDDWRNPEKSVAVGLSTVRFQEKYAHYMQCSSNLLPYSLEDMSLTVLLFGNKMVTLNEAQKDTIKQIVDLFHREGEQIIAVRVDGYADTRGTRLQNWVLTEERVDAVVQALVLLGVPEELLDIRPHGEKGAEKFGPFDQQRRVEIRLIIKDSLHSRM